MKRAIFASVILCMLSGVASAQEQGTGPNPYVDCGIGAAIFPDTAWAAASSNAIWDLGTTAITSALASPETCNAKQVATARLILETLPNLEKDIVNGEGTYLSSLQETMSCSADASVEMSDLLRDGFAAYVADEDYASQTTLEKATAMYALVKDYVDTSDGSCDVTL